MPRPIAASLRLACLAALAGLLGGCDLVVLHPAGDVAAQQRDLVVFATVLMLLIVVPVIATVGVFAWKYRAGNEDAVYEPDWDHSTQLELLIWSAPLLIVIALGAAAWTGTHLLDPYRPIGRLASGRPVGADAQPLEVEAIALDWKWLFIYPQYGVATVNELAAPVDRPIRFHLTASSVMNAFYVPTLAGMIYAMPSMETQLNAVVNRRGDYAGFSSNYSGAGFSGMHFRFHALDDAGFAAWIARNRAAPLPLTRANYLVLEKPTQKVPVIRFGRIDPRLFHAVANQCVRPGTTCMDMMMQGHAMTTMRVPGNDSGHPRSPLTTAQAGGAPPATPVDVKQRGNASPSQSPPQSQPTQQKPR